MSDAKLTHPQMVRYEWQKKPPKNDGDFYFSGKTPDFEPIVAIMQITTAPGGQRWGSIFTPPYWRGDQTLSAPTLYADKLENWNGEWAGPERGLTCVTNEHGK